MARARKPTKFEAGPKPGKVILAHTVVPHDESTALRDDARVPVPVEALERLYQAACVLDDRGFGNEMVDEILNTLTPYVSEEARDRIETEVHADPESGCEGG